MTVINMIYLMSFFLSYFNLQPVSFYVSLVTSEQESSGVLLLWANGSHHILLPSAVMDAVASSF